MYFLGVDQGSHSSRAVLFDQNGRAVADAAEKVTFSRSAQGRVEHDPHDLLASVKNVIQRVLCAQGVQQAGRVSACGIATQRSTALAWRADGDALSPALSWQDARAQDTVDRLKPRARAIMQLTGLPLTAYYSATKMNWLLRNSESVERCAREQLRLSPLASYLLYHLLEDRSYRIDFSNAQRTQLFELETLSWSAQLCDWFEVDPCFLPECMPMSSNYGRLEGTPIPVTCVCGDQNAAMFGSGALEAGVALINIGSGAFILRELDGFSASAQQLTGIASSDQNRVAYMREATVNGAGNALSWAEQQWRIDDLSARLPPWLEQVKEPPVFINAVGGLGTPWMQAGLQSSFVGKDDASIEERAVAIIESIVFMLQINLEIMAAEAPLKKLRVSGGLSNLDGLCRKLSSLSGLEVERADITEATARGAAWIAAGQPQDWNPVGSGHRACAHFKPERDAALQVRYRLFKAGIERLLETQQAGDVPS